MFRQSNFDKHLEKATSHLRLEPDWPSIMQICDTIRQGDTNAKQALVSIKKKMFSPNPHTSKYALIVLESIVKNCGAPVHDEISTKASCEMFTELVNTSPHENVRAKMLELIQCWAYAFRSSPKHRAIKDTMNILKAGGKKFPELKEADAMFTSDTAPEWVDGEVCNRCRTGFSLTTRQHHCRKCGQVFCHQCSSKVSTIPKFGIEKEVRVCDGCFDDLQKPTANGKDASEQLPAEYLSSTLAQQTQVPARKSDKELEEEEEENIRLAIALSQSEAEHKKMQSYQPRSYPKSISPVQKSPSPPMNEPESDPELARYLNRDYWEQRQVLESPVSPSAPSPMTNLNQSLASVTLSNNNGLKMGFEDTEIGEFSAAMRTQVEIFVNRMKSNSSRGRNISNDSSVQTLFINLTSSHSKLVTHIKNMDDKRMWYEQLQDKLAQVKDSRAALDVLRQEHQEKMRRLAEEMEHQRQLQMAQKLEIMRKKKQEYLQYQRQLAVQRIQEQEREMQMRQEQQKAQYMMQSTFPYLPQSPSHHHQQQGPQPPQPGMPFGGGNFANNPNFMGPGMGPGRFAGQMPGPMYGSAGMGMMPQPGMPQGPGMPNMIPPQQQPQQFLPNQMGGMMPGQPGMPPMMNQPQVPGGIPMTTANNPIPQQGVVGGPQNIPSNIPQNHPQHPMMGNIPQQQQQPQQNQGMMPVNPGQPGLQQPLPQPPPQSIPAEVPQVAPIPAPVVAPPAPVEVPPQQPPAPAPAPPKEPEVATAELISFD